MVHRSPNRRAASSHWPKTGLSLALVLLTASRTAEPAAAAVAVSRCHPDQETTDLTQTPEHAPDAARGGYYAGFDVGDVPFTEEPTPLGGYLALLKSQEQDPPFQAQQDEDEEQGKLDGMKAYMSGKMKIKGNMSLAQKVGLLF